MKHITLILLLVLIVPQAAICQVFVPRGESAAQAHQGWSDEKWTESDSMFDASAREVEMALDGGARASDLIKKYAHLVAQNPNDKTALFGWAYASYKGVPLSSTYRQRVIDLSDVSEALTQASVHSSYAFSRLRFLVAAPDVRLKQLGERLLQRRPDDFDVMSQLVYTDILSLAQDKDDPDLLESSVTLCDKLIARYPNTPRFLGMKGGIYYAAWDSTKRRQYAQYAIENYQTYLLMVPANAEFRGQAQALRNALKRWLKTD